jgi:hypothetical protein
MAETASGLLTQDNFWTHEFVRTQTPRGKLALCYVVFYVGDNPDISLEDMAFFSGLDMSECRNWLEYFKQKGQIRPEVRWD